MISGESHSLYESHETGQASSTKEELEAEMFEYIIQELERAGFEHYEISNFSKPGFESRHNLMYWDNAEYYGLGAGASGYVDGIRYKNHGPFVTICKLSKREMRVSKKSI